MARGTALVTKTTTGAGAIGYELGMFYHQKDLGIWCPLEDEKYGTLRSH